MLNKILNATLSNKNTSARKNIAAILATSAALVFLAAPGAKAAGDDDGMVFDSGTNYDNCMLEGGTATSTPTTYSCTIGDKTTTCDKRPADKDAACSTETAGRFFGGRVVHTEFVGATIVGPNNIVTPNNFLGGNKTLRRTR